MSGCVAALLCLEDCVQMSHNECFGGYTVLWVANGGYGAFCLLSTRNTSF